jgi:hypothetical protein
MAFSSFSDQYKSLLDEIHFSPSSKTPMEQIASDVDYGPFQGKRIDKMKWI